MKFTTRPVVLAVVFFCISALWQSLALALPVTGLYSQRIAVANESESERNRAYQEALAAVVLKVTGSRNWAEHSAVTEAVRNAQRYVEAISYSSETVAIPPEERIPEPTAEPTADDLLPGADPGDSSADNNVDQQPLVPVAPLPTTREQRFISVEFAPSLINSMLTNAGIPVWDNNRPSVLIWMVLQNSAGEREMLTAESNPEIIAAMREFARARGLPIIFPVLDFEDRRSLSTDQVWNLDEESIRAASERYGADSILSARLHFTAGGELVGLWQFIFQDETLVFDGFNTDLQEYLYGPLDRVTNQLASYFAISPQAMTQQQANLRVDGVGDLRAYSALLNYVQNLGLVEGVTTLALDGTRIELRLDLLGNPQQLSELIALDRDLMPIYSSTEELGNFLHYRWTR